MIFSILIVLIPAITITLAVNKMPEKSFRVCIILMILFCTVVFLGAYHLDKEDEIRESQLQKIEKRMIVKYNTLCALNEKVENIHDELFVTDEEYKQIKNQSEMQRIDYLLDTLTYIYGDTCEYYK